MHQAHLAMGGHIDIDCAMGGIWITRKSVSIQERDTTMFGAIFLKKGYDKG